MSMVLGGVAGALAGSFIGVVVERLPAGESVLCCRSRCRACSKVLGIVELVPVVSWLMQRGRCRSCRHPIGSFPLVLELACPMTSMAIVALFGMGGEAAAVWVATMALIALSIVDVRTHRLPREITYVALALVVAAFVAESAVRDDGRGLVGAFVGAAVFTGVLAAVRVVSRGGLGDGDVRLAPLLGALLGWWTPSLVPMAIVVASTTGAFVGGLGMACGRLDRRTPLPFGPFLALATLTTLFVFVSG